MQWGIDAKLVLRRHMCGVKAKLSNPKSKNKVEIKSPAERYNGLNKW